MRTIASVRYRSAAVSTVPVVSQKTEAVFFVSSLFNSLKNVRFQGLSIVC
jgi:hypothetical protein